MAMKNFEKQLSEGLRTHEQPNAEQVQRTVVAVQNMAAKHPPRNHRSWISFLIIQARFSGVSMWLWQILVLAAYLAVCTAARCLPIRMYRSWDVVLRQLLQCCRYCIEPFGIK